MSSRYFASHVSIIGREIDDNRFGRGLSAAGTGYVEHLYMPYRGVLDGARFFSSSLVACVARGASGRALVDLEMAHEARLPAGSAAHSVLAVKIFVPVFKSEILRVSRPIYVLLRR